MHRHTQAPIHTCTNPSIHPSKRSPSLVSTGAQPRGPGYQLRSPGPARKAPRAGGLGKAGLSSWGPVRAVSYRPVRPSPPSTCIHQHYRYRGHKRSAHASTLPVQRTLEVHTAPRVRAAGNNNGLMQEITQACASYGIQPSPSPAISSLSDWLPPSPPCPS